MKNKIKEILEGIEVVIKHDGTLEFDAKELKILRDYITNLQEENERLKTENKYFMKRNVRLHKQEKELLIDWHQEHNEAVNYKSRNEKAIRTLETLKGSARWERHLYEVDYLLNILQGEDKE